VRGALPPLPPLPPRRRPDSKDMMRAERMQLLGGENGCGNELKHEMSKARNDISHPLKVREAGPEVA
jgi:hypothetical protein